MVEEEEHQWGGEGQENSSQGVGTFPEEVVGVVARVVLHLV